MIKFSILFFLLLLSKFIFADITIGPVGEENLKKITEYKVDGSSVFIYEYSPPFPPHALTILLIKNCDCERKLNFYMDEKGSLFDVNNESVELKPKGFLNTLYAGPGELYKDIKIDEFITFEIIVKDIYQYRNPDIDKITAELFKFKWKKENGKYQLLEKNKEIILVDDLSENEEDSPPRNDTPQSNLTTPKPIEATKQKLDTNPQKNSEAIKAEPIKIAKGSSSVMLLVSMFGLLVLRLK